MVEIIDKQSCQDKVLIRLVRMLVIAAMHWNVCFRAKHISEKSNRVADHLSLFQFQEAHHLVPWFSPNETSIPDHLFHI